MASPGRNKCVSVSEPEVLQSGHDTISRQAHVSHCLGVLLFYDRGGLMMLSSRLFRVALVEFFTPKLRPILDWSVE